MALKECNVRIDAQGQELIEHGITQFPIACYNDDLAEMNVPWHWHEELEAVVVTEGTCLVTADSEKYIITEGNGFFINSSVLHGAWIMDCANCRFHSLVFHPRLVGGSLDSIFWQKYLYPLIQNSSLKGIAFDKNISWHKEILDSIEFAWQAGVHEPSGYEFLIRNALSRMIYLLCTNSDSAAHRPSEKALRDSERIKQMLQYIQEHFSEEITTSQLAQIALISESECLRCFHNTIGTTPIQYLKRFRIRKAAELLATTEEKITDIGIQCGFQEMSYFSKCFRQEMDCTPREYRKRQ